MASWSALRGTVRRLLHPGADAGPEASAPAGPPEVAASPTRAVQAWGALPAVQRVLVEPLEPVAPLAAFTSSLAAFQNPSFLGPLGHEVDAGVGGMVNGLADLAPIAPGVYGSGATLPVPTPAARRATRTVQRAWSGWPATEAVALEHPATLDEVTDPTEPTPSGPEPAELDVTVAEPARASWPHPRPAAPATLTVAEASAGPTAPDVPPLLPEVEAPAQLDALETTTPPGEQRSDVSPPSTAVQRSGSSRGTAEPPPQRGASASQAPAAALQELAATPPGDGAPRDPVPPMPTAVPPAAPLTSGASAYTLQRTLIVVSERAPRTARFPDALPRELPVSRVAAAAGPTPVPVASTVTEVVLPAAPDATISRGSDSSEVADDTPMVPGQSEHEAPPEPVGETPLTGSTSPLTALHPEGTTAEALRLSGDAPLQLSTTPAELPAAAGGPPASAPQVALQRRSDVEPAQPQTKPLSPDHPATGTASLPELPVVPEGPLLPAGSASLAPQPQLATPHLEKALAAPLQRRTATPPVLPPAAPLLGHREPLLQIPEKTVGPEPATTVQRLTFVLPPLASEEQGLSTPPPRRVLPSPVPTLRTGDARPASPPSPALVRAQVQRQREAASSLLPRQEGDAAPRSSGRTPPVAAQHFAPPPVVQRASAGPSAAEASPPADRPTVAASAPPSPGHAAGLASDQPEPESEGAIADLSYREPDDEVVAAAHILEPTLSLPPAGQPIALPRPDTLQRLTGDEIGPSAPAARDSVGFTASLDPRPMPPTPIVQRRSLPVTTPHRAGPAPEAITSSAAVPFASMFGGADPDPGDAGFTSVQLDTADGPVAGGAPTAPEASPTVQSVAAAAVPAPAPAASAGADLDEMARRLFEPLSARLRAELWLDRERAGLMSDARP